MSTFVQAAARRRWLAWLCLGLAAAGATGRLEAQVTAEAGLILLEAHLPPKIPAERADCQQLAEAVHAAVREQPKAAYAVVSMALSVPGKRLPRWAHRAPRAFACGCVTRIVHAAVMAAPGQGARILEAAVMLFPDCAEDLTAMLGQVELRIASLGATDGNHQDDDVMSATMLGNDTDTDSDGSGGGAGPGFAGGGGASPINTSGGSGGAGVLPIPTQPPVTSDANG